MSVTRSAVTRTRKKRTNLLDGQPRLPSGVKIDLVGALGELLLPGETDDVEDEEDGEGEVRLKETGGDARGVREVVSDGPDLRRGEEDLVEVSFRLKGMQVGEKLTAT